MSKSGLHGKAEFFLHLSTMENAGVPLIQAIESRLPNSNTKLNKTLSVLLANLKRGRSLATAGLAAGLLSDIESLIIKSATDSGKLDEALKRMAKQYEMTFTLNQKMKSQLVFPALIFILAVFIAPVPGLVSGTIDMGNYIKISIFFLIKVSLALYVLIKIPHWLKKGALKGLGLAYILDSLILKIPVLGKYYIYHQITRFIETLGMLLQAGIPALDAMPKAVGTIDNIIIKTSFGPVILRLKSQATLTEALVTNTYMPDESIQHIRAGELSGRLDKSLIHYGEIARAEVNLNFEQFTIWIPRIVYGIICIYMMNSIFNSKTFLPTA